MEHPVSTGGIIMMVLVLTLVWGGFALSLVVAIIHERNKTISADEAGTGRETEPVQAGRRDGGGH